MYKGRALVLMDKELCKAKGLCQLTNAKYYREIPDTISHETAAEINDIINRLHDTDVINDKQHEYLSDKPHACYLLPKVRKPKFTSTTTGRETHRQQLRLRHIIHL